MRDFWRGEAQRRRLRASASPARPTSTRATAASRSRRSTSSPRTTASRSRDLVSYNDKHNEANREDNRDGTDDNRSWNCGAEGPTDDPEIARAARAPAAELPRDAAPLAGRADAARRRRARRARRAATTTPTARTTRSRGSTGSSTSRTASCSSSRARLIALRQRAPGLPALDVPRRRRRGASGPAGRLVVPARRAQDDAARLGRAPTARTLGVFLNGAELRERTPHGEPVVDDSFLLLFNAHHEPVDVHAADAALRLALAARALDGRPGAGGGTLGARALLVECRSARSCCCGESEPRVADFRCTYRFQLGPELGFAARARARPVPAASSASSHLYLSPVLQARAGSTHGYDVVDPTRVSAELGGEDELRALCEAAHAAGLGIDPRRRPEPHGGLRGGEPLLARPGAARAVLRLGSGDGLAPALLRRRRARRRARRGSGGLRRDARGRCSSSSRDGLVDGLRIDHPDGLANPREYLERLRDARRRADLGGEDPRAGRAAARRLAGRGHDRLRVRERRRRRCSSTRPARSR